ncbi:MAG: hypothetical protein K0Q62_2303, partial [Phenylobacterium sp.]|nr:hypothetical protein [Phenylobacterium sp.]
RLWGAGAALDAKAQGGGRLVKI